MKSRLTCTDARRRGMFALFPGYVRCAGRRLRRTGHGARLFRGVTLVSMPNTTQEAGR